MNSGRPVRIANELQDIRELFNTTLSKKLGLNEFPKYKSDQILARAIQEANILNFDLDIQKKNKRGGLFDIEF